MLPHTNLKVEMAIILHRRFSILVARRHTTLEEDKDTTQIYWPLSERGT